MAIEFDFSTVDRIIFGINKINSLPDVISQFGRKVLFVCGKNHPSIDLVLNKIMNAGLNVEKYIISGEPDLNVVQEGATVAKSFSATVIVGFGGGSVIDAAKAIAAISTNTAPILEYLEIIGSAKPLLVEPLPVIAIPTTAGTGSEVTRNAVITSFEHQIKVSLRHSGMLPKVALIDPALGVSMSPTVTAFTGLDALTQLIEPYLSNSPNAFTDIFCLDGMKRISRSIERAYMNGTDILAREDMAFASLLSGIALANSKLGAVHGFAGPIGGMFNANHGAICAALLPYVLSTNLSAIRERVPGSGYLHRFKIVAQTITGDPNSEAEMGIHWIHELNQKFSIPRLSDFGIKREDFDQICEKARSSSSMKGNPIVLTNEEMNRILDNAY